MGEEEEQGLSTIAGVERCRRLLQANLGGFSEAEFELRRVASQQIASGDSVHRNIAEGYCRRSIHEYLKFLYIALGSLGESVSGLYACREAGQVPSRGFRKTR